MLSMYFSQDVRGLPLGLLLLDLGLSLWWSSHLVSVHDQPILIGLSVWSQ